MTETVAEGHALEALWGRGVSGANFESVEFAIEGLSCLHQFRIWNTVPEAMCILLREDSEVLGRLKVGDTFELKYYTTDQWRPTRYLETAIRRITKEDEGRFRGHYVVGLEILDRP